MPKKRKLNSTNPKYRPVKETVVETKRHELICTVSETRLDSWQDIDSLPTLVSKSKSDGGAT